MSSWKVTYDQFKPAQEGLREALCTLGNGYFAARGAVSEYSASRIHYPGTYIAGVYNKLTTRLAGQRVANEDIVNCPNWLPLSFRIGKGEWITPSPSTGRLLSYYQELDMRRGLLIRRFRHNSHKGQITSIESTRFVHIADPHRAAIRYIITSENYDGWITVRSGLDGTVQNTGVARYRQLNCRHLQLSSMEGFSRNGIYLSMKTVQSGIEIAEAAKLRIFTEGKEIRHRGIILTKGKKEISHEFRLFIKKGQSYEVEKLVSIYTSKDGGIRAPVPAAIDSVQSSQGFDVLLKTHQQAWNLLWKKFDIQIDGDEFSQKVLRLHIFHLLQTGSIHNVGIDAGLPARGLHGEAYRGHIFWDELFVLPFFDLHSPEISKAFLLYRYQRLAQAREYAKENGYNGAMFPWQSGATGWEETQLLHLNPMSGKWGPDYSRIQRHISFAIAYNIWQYWGRTGDLDFLKQYGAETLLSIARFGASLAKYSSKDKRYHTEGIMGPDEFHEKFPGAPNSGLKDNAYTNILIVWTLLKAQEALAILPKPWKEALLKKIGMDQKELRRWQDITKKMKIVINDSGIISQFQGYFRLKELNWEAYKAEYGKIQRMDRILKAEGKSPNEYKVAKQADVLMLFYIFTSDEVQEMFHKLGYKFSRNTLKKNYEYYIKRTSHGSTLSKVVHCYIAYLLRKEKDGWERFLEVLKSDIYDTQGGTTSEGIHTGVMGGSIDIVMRAFAGINLLEDRVKISPNLPKFWQGLKLQFSYKESWFSLSITKARIEITVRAKKPRRIVPVEICGRVHKLSSGKRYRIGLGN